MKAALAMILILAAGCRHPVPQVPAKVQEVPAAQKAEAQPAAVETVCLSSKAICALGDYAGKHNIAWRIFCTSDENRESYMGVAGPTGHPLPATDIEDGGVPGWWTDSDVPTQDATARELLALVKGAHNYFPDHRPPPEKSLKVRCLRPVTGNNYKEPCAECTAP